MRVRVVRRHIPYGGEVYVLQKVGCDQVVWLDEDAFTEKDASLMAERLVEDPRLLCALLSAAA